MHNSDQWMGPLRWSWLRFRFSLSRSSAVGALQNIQDTHPVPSGAIDQLLGMKATFLLPRGEQNQEVWEIIAQDATSKSFISVKTKGFLRPCIHQGQPPPLLRCSCPPAPVAASAFWPAAETKEATEKLSWTCRVSERTGSADGQVKNSSSFQRH